MIKRSKQILKLKYLYVYQCSNEDIFTFKSMTTRPGDIKDCIELVKRGINWKIILNEIKCQINDNGQDVWITWIGERFDILLKKNINIPIMKEIDQLRNKHFNRLVKKLNSD